MDNFTALALYTCSVLREQAAVQLLLDTEREENRILRQALVDSAIVQFDRHQATLSSIACDRQAELKVRLCRLISSKLPFYPCPVRGGGLCKVVFVKTSLSDWQWDCLAANTPTTTTPRVCRFEILRATPHNDLQATLLALTRAGPGGGVCSVLGLRFTFNPTSCTLRIQVDGDSVNSGNVRVLERALNRRGFASAGPLAFSTAAGSGCIDLY
jgi:hypothetical protein